MSSLKSTVRLLPSISATVTCARVTSVQYILFDIQSIASPSGLTRSGRVGRKGGRENISLKNCKFTKKTEREKKEIIYVRKRKLKRGKKFLIMVKNFLRGSAISVSMTMVMLSASITAFARGAHFIAAPL